MKFFTSTSGAEAPDEIPIVEQLIIFSIGTMLPEQKIVQHSNIVF